MRGEGVGGRANDGHPPIAGHAHADHVAVDELANPHSGVESALDDVREPILGDDLEPELGIRRPEVGQARGEDTAAYAKRGILRRSVPAGRPRTAPSDSNAA